MSVNIPRRTFIKQACVVLAVIPALTLSAAAGAVTNTELRKKLQYQPTPKDGMSCNVCLEFLAGKTERDFGRCKVIPGDDEISPAGYCIKWNSM